MNSAPIQLEEGVLQQIRMMLILLTVSLPVMTLVMTMMIHISMLVFIPVKRSPELYSMMSKMMAVKMQAIPEFLEKQ